MIFEGIITVFVKIIGTLLSPFNYAFSDNIFDFLPVVEPYFQAVCYILPMNTIIKVLSLLIAIEVFKICIALAKTIVTFIPMY